MTQTWINVEAFELLNETKQQRETENDYKTHAKLFLSSQPQHPRKAFHIILSDATQNNREYVYAIYILLLPSPPTREKGNEKANSACFSPTLRKSAFFISCFFDGKKASADRHVEHQTRSQFIAIRDTYESRERKKFRMKMPESKRF